MLQETFSPPESRTVRIFFNINKLKVNFYFAINCFFYSKNFQVTRLHLASKCFFDNSNAHFNHVEQFKAPLKKIWYKSRVVLLYLYWVILHSRFYLNYYLDRKQLLLQTLDPLLAAFREFPETTNELADGEQSEEATDTVDQMSIDDSPSVFMFMIWGHHIFLNIILPRYYCFDESKCRIKQMKHIHHDNKTFIFERLIDSLGKNVKNVISKFLE